MKRVAVYPASLDPIHYGHIDVATRALHIFDEVIVTIYSTPKKKNMLFDLEERVELAQKCFEAYDNIQVTSFSGLAVDYVQSVGAVAIIRGLRVFGDFEFEFRMGMANKKLAPNIETVAILASERYMHISSSTVREIAELGGDVTAFVPDHVVKALKARFA
ncbi:pantetheine-phosphate adenylyltransferase [Phototrophicus methaneseepsis]|uniref:Phosphopantetheine adenylyltransferase n=1 Tax=Phototrophicus methaneseepsis TaxID=2710758 RepID=A0A7S8E546_9CHLR|nr:pantetheine-phosphate adenylyltransferase [Phototrophicus methaneseepsis]QPC80552.1 pantetheine-phosphate adenylyltransferase [Phototrophicus methaneseepsis]